MPRSARRDINLKQSMQASLARLRAAATTRHHHIEKISGDTMYLATHILVTFTNKGEGVGGEGVGGEGANCATQAHFRLKTTKHPRTAGTPNT